MRHRFCEDAAVDIIRASQPTAPRTSTVVSISPALVLVPQRLWRDPVPPRSIRKDCPPWLQEVILKCLEVKPERRYQSAAQLALALQDPSQVPLTARAEKVQASGLLLRFKRWFFAAGADPQAAPQLGVASQVAKSPIIVAAVDVENAGTELLERLRETVQRIVLTEPGARLACVSVMRTARIGMDERVDAEGQSVHVKQLVGLRHWARPISRQLDLGEGRLTFHVLEAPDPAAALVEFAESAGLQAIAYGPQLEDFYNEDFLRSFWVQVVRNPTGALRQLWAPIIRYWPETNRTLRALADGADLLSTGLNFEQAAANVAEHYHIPLVSLHHFPMRPNSEVVPTLPPPLVRSTGKVLEWLFWRATKTVENEQRDGLGLPKATVSSPRRIADRGSLEIQAYDAICFPGLKEEWSRWAAQRPFVGALTMELSTGADEEVEAWIATGHYGDLILQPAIKGPVMVHHVPRFLRQRRSAGRHASARNPNMTA